MTQSMTATNTKLDGTIHQWLENEFIRRNISALIHDDLIRYETNWLIVVPVYIQGVRNNHSTDPDYLEYIKNGDHTTYVEGVLEIHDRAAILQEVEDAWNDQTPKTEVQLVLRPAGR